MVRRTDRHGGDVHAVVRETGRPLRAVLDFSASINPLGPSPLARRALVASLATVTHYPDPACVALRDALAKRHDLPADWFLVGNGSSELIALLPLALSIRHALIVGPTFSEYERAVTAAGGLITRVQASREKLYRPRVESVLAAIRAEGRAAGRRPTFDAVFLCNPNSPTGWSVPREAVREVARAAARRGLWMIVDETFADYCEERSVLPWLQREPRLLLLRSFTKFYALPGLRIGYLAARPALLARLRRRQPPWSVNQPAQAAALAALEDRAHAARSLAFMRAERARLASRLARLPGLTVVPSEANFLMVELPRGLTALRVVAALRREGLLIRDCSGVPGLNDRTIRVAVRSRTENRRLFAGLRSRLQGRIP